MSVIVDALPVAPLPEPPAWPLLGHLPWEDPDRFDPDRFLPERMAARPSTAWIPFGAGQRQCIGKGFATMEGVFLLAMILQRYRFETIPGEPVRAALSLTRRPREGLRLRAVPVA